MSIPSLRPLASRSQVEKRRHDKYTGKFYNPLTGKCAPPAFNLSMTYEATIVSMNIRTMLVTRSYFDKVAIDASDPQPIFDGAQMAAINAALLQCEKDVKHITHCDGDERLRMERAGCDPDCAVNLHRITQRILGLPFGGRLDKLPPGLTMFSCAENVIATLMLLPPIHKDQKVTLAMMKSIVRHNSNSDTTKTQLQTHVPIFMEAKSRPCPAPPKRRRTSGGSPSASSSAASSADDEEGDTWRIS